MKRFPGNLTHRYNMNIISHLMICLSYKIYIMKSAYTYQAWMLKIKTRPLTDHGE